MIKQIIVENEPSGKKENKAVRLPDGSPQSELRSGNEIYSRIQEISDAVRAGTGANIEKLKKQPSRFEIEDAEKWAALDYAKSNDLWIRDFYSLGRPMRGGGNENTLAFDEANGVVFKSNNLFNAGQSVLQLLQQTENHNVLFPETYYDIVGFTGIDSSTTRTPYIEVILKQNFIANAVQAAPSEIDSFMEQLGFKKSGKGTFKNEEYIVSDLYPRNVLKNNAGILFVVDDIIKRVEV